jgi:hypothetical protein
MITQALGHKAQNVCAKSDLFSSSSLTRGMKRNFRAHEPRLTARSKGELDACFAPGSVPKASSMASDDTTKPPTEERLKLPAPEDAGEKATELKVGATISLDALGPLVVNNDGVCFPYCSCDLSFSS